MNRRRPTGAVTHPVDGGGEVWLERDGPALALDGLVLERFATAVAIARKRARTATPRHGDQALVDLMIRRSVDSEERAQAIQLLGLVPESPVRVLAVAGRATKVLSRCPRLLGKATFRDVLALMVHGDEDVQARLLGGAANVRVGVGPCVPAGEAWRSWHAAAWRSASPATRRRPSDRGSAQYPGVVFWDDLGGFAALAEFVPSEAISEVPDVAALDRLAAERTGAMTLAALRALCETESIRLAARTLHMHHSSVGQRLDHAEGVLGFPVRTALGRNRLSLALTLRRLRESGDDRPAPFEAASGADGAAPARWPVDWQPAGRDGGPAGSA